MFSYADEIHQNVRAIVQLDCNTLKWSDDSLNTHILKTSKGNMVFQNTDYDMN